MTEDEIKAAREELSTQIHTLFGRQIPEDEVLSALRAALSGAAPTGIELNLAILWQWFVTARGHSPEVVG